MSLFREASRLRTSDDIVDQIQRAIVGGKLRPGDRLPPERELQKTFEVGRATIREALRILENRGLLTMRLGATGGAFVAESSTRVVTQSLALLLERKEVDFAAMAEFRQFLEGMQARLAAERALPSDLDRLVRISEEYRALLARPDVLLGDLVEKDVEFHLAVALAAKNPVSYAVTESVIELARTAFQFIPDGHRQQIHDDMVHVLEALRAKDGDRAAAVLTEHIRSFNAMILEERGRRTEGRPR